MFNKLDYLIDYRNKKILLNSKPKFIRKITGTHIRSLVDYDNKESKFGRSFNSAVSRVLSISEPIGNTIYVDVGQKYEELVLPLLENKFPNAQIEHIIPSIVNYDYFPKNEIFGGVPDFLIHLGREKIVLDVKTKKASTKKYGVDSSYVDQVNLYKKLLNFDKAYILFIYLDYPHDYINIDIQNKDIQFLDVTKSNEYIEGCMIEAKNTINKILENKEILNFDLKKNYPILQLLEARNQAEREERRIILENIMKLSWY